MVKIKSEVLKGGSWSIPGNDPIRFRTDGTAIVSDELAAALVGRKGIEIVPEPEPEPEPEPVAAKPAKKPATKKRTKATK